MVSTSESESSQVDTGLTAKGVKTISCHSHLMTETFSHTWRMHNFNDIPLINRYPFFSPNFGMGKKSESLWQVVMTKHYHWINKPKCDEDDSSDEESDEEDYEDIEEEVVVGDLPEDQQSDKKPEKIRRIGLRLEKVDDNSSWDAVNYHFTLKTKDGFTISTLPREEPGNSEYEGKPMFSYLTEKDFGERDIFSEKSLDVICNITYKYIDGNPFDAPEVFEGKKIDLTLRTVYISNKFCDVVLVSRGIEHVAHKSVLWARAREFENLLKEDKELVKQKLDLKVDEEVGKAMVKFMYCGELTDCFPSEKCVALHEAAEKFAVCNLKRYCSNYFKQNLDPEVCRECLFMNEPGDCLVAVRKLSADKLKQVLSKEKCSHKAT